MSRILIIEDDPTIRRGLKDSLEAESYEVLTAADGEVGLRLSQEGYPDLIILDLMLPKRSGYEICRQLRGECGERQVPNADVGLTHNVGGIGQYCFVHVFKNS